MGAHLDEQRVATAVLDAGARADGLAEQCGDAFWPALGYLCGIKSEASVPVVVGLEQLAPTRDHLKAFSAAFGSTASVALYHIEGVTPEAPTAAVALDNKEPATSMTLSRGDLAHAWRLLDSGRADHASDAPDEIQLVSLGNPHLSLSECKALAELCDASAFDKVHPNVSLVACMGRFVYDEAAAAGYIPTLEKFGMTFITDTCWCMLKEPVVPLTSTALVTNSGKWAHYAPGQVDRKVRFTDMAGCIEAAATGHVAPPPSWVVEHG